MNTKLYSALAAALSLSLMTGAHAATLNVNSAGTLLGASGVMVGSKSYNVVFVEGTCLSTFGGCDQASDFLFTSSTDANAASQALLDQVLIDVPAQGYAFDSSPEKTFGCSSTARCNPLTPMYLYGSGSYVFVSYADNESAAPVDAYWKPDNVAQVGEPVTLNTASQPILVWAVWSETPATPTVPVPAAAWLFGSGLVGLAGLSRRKSHRA